ncbi:hypothetical protein RvY_07627 [Ramazzottius varieornatus]|uniref:Uncharacterized protein n=1 Tax=Ramazzottius varieornatus TaxID=947166 RepID=A0A1D1V2V8_RAMVA|nr:hypothetical protein RvY_07627 [Ramazzottius varieornatus]
MAEQLRMGYELMQGLDTSRVLGRSKHNSRNCCQRFTLPITKNREVSEGSWKGEQTACRYLLQTGAFRNVVRHRDMKTAFQQS